MTRVVLLLVTAAATYILAVILARCVTPDAMWLALPIGIIAAFLIATWPSRDGAE